MTEDEWGALVARLEEQAGRNPRRYARKVLLLGLLGYAALGLALLILVGLAVLVAVLAVKSSPLVAKAIIPIVGLGWVIVRSLRVDVPPPDGVPVSRADAPALFEMIDDVRRRVAGPRIHHVLVDGQYNAGVVQIPRVLGLFGQRNYLVLGLPYMQAVSPGEFRAVVAHELGHLSRNHGRLGSWIYRINATWLTLLGALEERRRLGTELFRRFFAWYQPRFAAYSFPLRRMHEFEADRAAADAAGAQPAATALVSAVLGASYLDNEYWPRVYERAATEPSPPAAVFRSLPASLLQAKEHARAAVWIERELSRPASPGDTHPPIAARIGQLGLDVSTVVEAAREERNGSTAAEVLLGAAAAPVAVAVDSAWRASVRDAWAEHHRGAQQARARLGDLEEQAQSGELTPEEAAERCSLVEALDGAEAALPLYEQLRQRRPDDAPTLFAVGRLRLARGDESGLELLERAMEADAEAIVPACEIAFGFLMEHGRDEEAERYRARAIARLEELSAAQEERSTITADDELVPADLAPELVAELRADLQTFPEVRRAYLVRKKVRHLDDEYPFYILGVVAKKRFRTLWRDMDEGEHTLAARIAAVLKLPIELRVIVPGPLNALTKRLASIPGAEIVRR